MTASLGLRPPGGAHPGIGPRWGSSDRWLSVGSVLAGLLFLFATPTPIQGQKMGQGHRFITKSIELVNIKTLEDSIEVALSLATPDNILGVAVYEESRCLLQREVAEALVRAQGILAMHGLRLMLKSCYRPLSVQRRLWESLPNRGFIADPRSGSCHNRGAAIDVTLVDAMGEECDMGSQVHELGPSAYRWVNDLGPEVDRNRTLLEEILEAEGFRGIDSEWWHFNHVSWPEYPLMDFPLDRPFGTTIARPHRRPSDTGGHGAE